MYTRFHVLVSKVNPFWIQLGYFTSLSFLGFLALKFSRTRADSSASGPPKDLDVFFTSVSAATVSSMSTVEMEVFSNFQLVVMTILMLAGGEVFTSMFRLHLAQSKLRQSKSITNESIGSTQDNGPGMNPNQKRLNFLELQPVELQPVPLENNKRTVTDPEKGSTVTDSSFNDEEHLKYRSIRCLAYVVLCYFLVFHVLGSSLVTTYVSSIPSAREVLRNKGISIQTFSVFTVVSTFSNCGFIPTNENMMVFKNNSGLLLLLVPQILVGNTLYPTCLRMVLWALEKATRRVEFGYILRNDREIGYEHLLSGLHSWLLGATVLGFTAVQFVLLCSMEWRSEVMEGMSPYQKLVGSLFQTVNSRHTGEFVFDISVISPAILVLYVVTM